MLNTSVNSMGKTVELTSLNSSISNSVITTTSSHISNHHHHHNQSNHNLTIQQNTTQNLNSNLKYQSQPNSKRKSYLQQQQQQQHHQQMEQSHLHLNSLWSIWYGVLITLFQGYLAIHGAYRFLGCSLIIWKIEPVAELNTQIVLCGVVFILLPLFFASAVFKVGNLANDGIKLASMSQRKCSVSPHDGLEEEARGGTLRALWTHGGPTAAFLHIVIALCLLLPRLLLEARIIENGFLPKENIWKTELDFISTNRDRLIVLSFMTSPYKNISNDYSDPDEFLDNFLEEYNQTIPNEAKDSDITITRSNPKTTLIELTNNHEQEDDLDDYDDENDDEILGFPKPFEEFDMPKLPATTTERITSTTSTTSTTTTTTVMTPTHNTHRGASRPNKSRKHNNHGRNKKVHKSRNYNTDRSTSKSEETDRELELKPDRIDFSRFNEFEMSTIFESNSNSKIRPTSSSPRSSKESSAEQGLKKSSKAPASKDSNIHIVKPEKLPDILPSTPISSNSKIIEIKPKKLTKRMIDEELQIEIEPEYLISSPTNQTLPQERPTKGIPRLDGFSGMLQRFFGVEKEIDVAQFNYPPSMEFVNLVIGLIVWTVRYPAVFWSTTKPFAAIFSLQMISSALDIIFGYTGVSNLYKLQIVSEAMPIQNPGLILNAVVTLSLYILSTILLISSSLILYLYGHGRLAAKMRDRSVITMKTSETWIYFAHCASLCFVLALSVVKAPLLNDLSATYRNNLNCPTFISALVSVVQLFLWIVIWLGLTAKRRWAFKLPPIPQYGVAKGATQPLLISTRTPHNSSIDSGNGNQKGNGGGAISTTSSTDCVEDIYWPKLTPNSPKLKVTFNEVTSTSDDVLLISEQDGKRHTARGTSLCLTSSTGEIDDGEYATLRSAPGGGGINGGNSSTVLHLSEYDELPPPPAQLLKPPSQNGSTGDLLDDNTSEEGKLLACVRDDSVTYASTRDLEPPRLPPQSMRSPLAQPENMQLPPSPSEEQAMQQQQQQLHQMQNVSYQSQSHYQNHQQLLNHIAAPVTVTVHSNEAHNITGLTPRCLRRADSGVPNEALTPRSDTESTTSPPERAPSESSSGVHSGEEREEVVIRPRAINKAPAKLPQPAIEEEPYGRSTNMRMSSFNNDGKNNNNPLMSTSSSATLPLTRSIPDQHIDYSQSCNTMPLPMNCHQSAALAAGGSASMSNSHYKSQIYSPPTSNNKLNFQDQNQMQHTTHTQHTTLPNGVRYSNPLFLKRLPHVTKGESIYGHLGYGSGHHTFSKLLQDPLHNLANKTIPEDRDSANYSMSSDQDCLYINAHPVN